MQTQESDAAVASAVLDALLPSRTRFVKCPTPDQLTTAELFVVLCSAGATFDARESKRLATELLYSCREALSGPGPLRGMTDDEYAKRVVAFVEDLSAHRAPAALAERFTQQITDRLAEELRGRFLERIRLAAAAGVVDPPPATARVASPAPASASTAHSLSLAAQLAAAAFLSWSASARAAPDAPPRPAAPPADKAAAAAPAPAAKGAALAKIAADVRLFETSVNARQRVEAIESLAALGPIAASALPALRRQLGIRGGDGLRRAEAAWAIGHISVGDAKDLAALQAALRDENRRVSRIASLSLGHLGKAAMPALRAIADSGAAYPKVIECIRTQSREACDWVKDELDGEGPLVRLLFEQQLNRPRAPSGGVCMCSLR